MRGNVEKSKRRNVEMSGLRAGFSLLEIMIAIGILGVGMVMVAAMFPVALTQHRKTYESEHAQPLVSKAEPYLHGRIDSAQLWANPEYVMAQLDSPLNMLPMANLYGRDSSETKESPQFDLPYFWDRMPVVLPGDYRIPYANAINDDFYAVGNPIDLFAVSGLDMLSDRVAPFYNPTPVEPFTWPEFRMPSPFTPEEFSRTPIRFAWVGFYRRLTNGDVNYAVAVCRIKTGDAYREQDVAARDFTNVNEPIPARPNMNHVRRIPVPWRVRVALMQGDDSANSPDGEPEPRPHKLYLTNNPGSGNAPNWVAMGNLAPIGSKIIIHGAVYGPPNTTRLDCPVVPAGKVLTVSNVFDNTNDNLDNPAIIEVMEDLRDLPLYRNNAGYSFDVWVFPPPDVAPGEPNGTSRVLFGRESPLVEWKTL